ncbi:MAG: alpha-L-fucosidase [Alistipes sp.]|nr:alpha-L-fucosidase [Candidatus Minthomonas equi]
MRKLSCILSLIPFFAACSQVTPPAPYGPTPNKVQLEWQELEFYAFVHFTTNTFTDMEWGLGNSDPSVFNPTEFDVDQWMDVFKSAGMKAVVLTAKHHDGFCLWPSGYTEYSVKNSVWKDGKGDVVGAVSEAAQKHGLKFGVYLSPWDRHDDRYGTSEYVDYYRNQIRELLTDYGPIFEFWKDGANGGTGYYGGTESQERRVDARTYYDWENTHILLRDLQADVFIFGGCTDGRWCGNEQGHVGETNWCRLNKDKYHLGVPYNMDGLYCGEDDGTHWVPAEVDVSIRPGWFWHENENSKVKSPERLLDIYYTSVGRGANLILNIPPNDKGLISDEDVRSLEGFAELLKKEFGHCVNDGIKKAEATQVRGGSRTYSAKQVLDEDHETYWTTEDSTTSASLIFTFKNPTVVNRAMLREYLPLGQRIASFNIEAQTDSGEWIEIAAATTIGHKRLLRFDDVTTKVIRINILDSKACPVLSDVKFYESTNPLKRNESH